MKRSIGLSFLFILIAVNVATAGRTTSCENLPTGIFDPATQTAFLYGIEVLGTQFDVELNIVQDNPFQFGIANAAPTQTPNVPGGTFDPAANSALIQCVDIGGFYYWAELPLASTDPPRLGVSGADLVRDLTDTTLILPLVTGTSVLGLGDNGQALLDNVYSGTWDQKGNDLFVSIQGGITFFDLTLGPDGVSGLGNHFGQTTSLTQLHPTNTTLNLNNDRFQVKVDWRDSSTASPTSAIPVRNGEDSGLIWFFDPDNTELLVKVLNNCSVDNHYWVFAAGLTNVEFTLTVTDTQTSAVNTYTNTLGQTFSTITDTSAFATCP
jgi:hypothetical protein